MSDDSNGPEATSAQQAPLSRLGDPCAGCASPVATRHAAPGGAVWLCPSCAAGADLGCP